MEPINYNTENSIFFSIARMNPPTPGHLLLIKKLIEEALKRGVNKVYIILSKSNSDNENPIECNEKIKVLGFSNNDLNSMTTTIKDNIIQNNINNFNPELVKNMVVEYVCVRGEEYTPLQTLSRIIYYDYKDKDNLNLFIIIGEDRQNLVDNISDIYIKDENNKVKTVDAIVLQRESMKKFKGLDKTELSMLDMTTIPVEAISASFVRNIVKFDLKDKFFELYRPYLKDDVKIENLYNSIKIGLNKPEPNKKYEKIKQPKYTYPLLLNSYRQKGKRSIKEEPEEPIKKSTRARTRRGGKNKKSRKTKKNKKTKKQRKNIKLKL